jgi:hypothetical protein
MDGKIHLFNAEGFDDVLLSFDGGRTFVIYGYDAAV